MPAGVIFAGLRRPTVGRRTVGVILRRRRLIALTEVRPIDGEGGDDLAQRGGEAAEREVARAAVLLGDAVEAMAQHVQLGSHRGLHDEPLALVDHLRERRAGAYSSTPATLPAPAPRATVRA